MYRLILRVLGTFQALLDAGESAHFRSENERALLVYLAMNPGRPHSRETLATLLWPEIAEGQARNNLRVTLFRLRKSLTHHDRHPDWLQIDPDQVLIIKDNVKTDALVFEELLTMQADSHLIDNGIAKIYQEAAEIYGGEFLEGFNLVDDTPFGQWARIHRERFHRLAMRILWQLADYHLRRGQLHEALQYAQRQLEYEPWREEAHRQLMRVLALGGERTAALAQYELCRRNLEQELGTRPSAETDELRERIEALYHTRSSHLPAGEGHFIGRDGELARLGEMLADPSVRMITLVGPGGCGKSRLILQVAKLHTTAFLHGVHWVDLTTMEDVEKIPSAIAASIEFSPAPHRNLGSALLDYLARKEMLLVLDNFEHLMEGAPFVDRLLESAPNVRILVSSRSPLSSLHEHVYRVDGLSLVVDGSGISDAMRFFESSAQRTNPNFHLSGPRTAEVSRVCSLVGGIPLAIEMAAALTDSMTAGEIANQIVHTAEILRLNEVVAARHRSMRAVFDSSWNQLPEDGKSVLARLAVFAGPFERQAALAVAGASTMMLRTLVNRSLLRRVDEDGGRAAFSFHPLVKEFAFQCLDSRELEAARESHLSYYHNFLMLQNRHLHTSKEPEAMRALQSCLVDAWQSLQYAVSLGRIAMFTPLLFFLIKFYDFQADFREAASIFEGVLHALQEAKAGEGDLSQAFAALAWYRMRLGAIEEAETLGRRSLEMARRAGDPPKWVLVQVPNMLGIIALNYHGDAARAKALIQESLDTAKQYNDAFGMANILNLGMVALKEGKLEAAEALTRQAQVMLHQLGNQWAEANALELLCDVLTARGEYHRAGQITERLLKLRQEIGHRWGVAKSLARLGELAYLREDHHRAVSLLTEALVLVREYGDIQYASQLSMDLARAHLALGSLVAAKMALRSWLRDTDVESLASRVELQLDGSHSSKSLKELIEIAREALIEEALFDQGFHPEKSCLPRSTPDLP